LRSAPGVPAFRLTGNSGRGIQVRAGHMEQIKPGTWNHLAFTYDGSREQSGLNMFWNGKAIPNARRRRSDGSVEGQHRLLTLRCGSAGRVNATFEDGAIADFRILTAS